MAGNNRRGSLIAGVILIGVGGLFLLENWLGMSWFWFWSLLATWWPLILIAIGLRKIVRYFSYETR